MHPAFWRIFGLCTNNLLCGDPDGRYRCVISLERADTACYGMRRLGLGVEHSHSCSFFAGASCLKRTTMKWILSLSPPLVIVKDWSTQVYLWWIPNKDPPDLVNKCMWVASPCNAWMILRFPLLLPSSSFYPSYLYMGCTERGGKR